jgi:competence CoiA-like predicted nuclease
MVVKLQYAMDTNGKSISFDDPEVKSGQGQEFTCPDPYCNIKVQPKKGEVRQNHFAHKCGSNCYGLETSLHLMAKEAFLSMKTFRLPIYFISPREYHMYY